MSRKDSGSRIRRISAAESRAKVSCARSASVLGRLAAALEKTHHAVVIASGDVIELCETTRVPVAATADGCQAYNSLRTRHVRTFETIARTSLSSFFVKLW